MGTTAKPAQADQVPQQSDASVAPEGTSVKKPDAVGAGAAQKKKSKKHKSKSKKKKATGFEAIEYQEEKDIYSPERPFHERIETCIQRFRARRRLNSARTNLFSYYLLLGGVDSTPRQFQGTTGIGDEDLEDASKEHIQAMTANDVIARGDLSERYYNPDDDKHWTVDFTGVVSGFLSEWLPKNVGVSSTLIHDGIAVVLNFLKYVMMHDVCPEYKDDILEAQKVCEKAKEELSNVGKASQALPGYFNRAARSLFCADDDHLTFFNAEQALDKSVALKAFHATLLAWPDPEHHRKDIDPNSISVIHTAEQDFVVIPIPEAEYPGNGRYQGTVQPRVDQIRQYKSVKLQVPSGQGDELEETTLIPCGVVRLAPTTIQDCWDVGSATPACPSWIGPQEDIFLETDIAKCLEPGSKMRLVICELNCGIKFIKEFKAVYPTFYTFLPQELMLKYKKPVLSERAGPSVDDSDTMDEDEAAFED